MASQSGPSIGMTRHMVDQLTGEFLVQSSRPSSPWSPGRGIGLKAIAGHWIGVAKGVMRTHRIIAAIAGLGLATAATAAHADCTIAITPITTDLGKIFDGKTTNTSFAGSPTSGAVTQTPSNGTSGAAFRVTTSTPLRWHVVVTGDNGLCKSISPTVILTLAPTVPTANPRFRVPANALALANGPSGT